MHLSRLAPIAIVAVMLVFASQAEAQAPPSITITEGEGGAFGAGFISATHSLDFPITLSIPSATPESIRILGSVPNGGQFFGGLELTDAAGVSDILTVADTRGELRIDFTSDTESPLPPEAGLTALDESTCLPLGCQFSASIPVITVSGNVITISAFNFDVFVLSDADATVPEPATAVLVGAGILAFAGVKLRRRRS